MKCQKYGEFLYTLLKTCYVIPLKETRKAKEIHRKSKGKLSKIPKSCTCSEEVTYPGPLFLSLGLSVPQRPFGNQKR